MLLLPKGQTIYSGLKTAFTQFDAMLAELGSNGFTGYVRVTASGYGGVLLLDTGKVITALGESQGLRKIGPPAAQELAAQARGTDGTIDVCKLSHEWVSVLSGMSESDHVFGKLTTDLVDLAALIKKLQSSRHTGHVQVTLRAQGGEGLVLLQDGQLIECTFSDEAGRQPEEVLPRLLRSAMASGADIIVYRAEMERALSQGEIISAALDLPRLVEIWQKIIQTVEITADSLTRNGAFANAFRTALDARAHDYGFLHQSVFVYKNGQLKYDGKPEQDFNRAIGDCVGAAIDQLGAKDHSANLKMKTKVSLQPVRRELAGQIKALALEDALDWDLTPYECVLAQAWPFLGNSSDRIVERQCREHLGMAPTALGFEHMRELGHWVEVSSALVISKEQARALGQKISDLSRHQEQPSP